MKYLVLFLALSAVVAVDSPAKTNVPKQFPLWNFDEIGPSCRAKGRLQDREYCNSKLMETIISFGKGSIPVLISQLQDTRHKTTRPIYDFWSETSAADIAYFILNDLFTDSDWATRTMPGLDALPEKCIESAETCWRAFVKKHGRKFVHDQWLAAWNVNKDRIYWDEQTRCFRVR
ncbi:MAG TPA: hypothetical protein VKW06_05140 [Candidatus Angelobacter sp.]|nr:hypothetical protein [Candidatus Angelobacter sp.]